MNKNARYAFYGTLRSGMENNTYYGHHAFKSLEIVELKGFFLYSLGEYPYAVRTGDLTKTIKAELFYITDRSIEKALHEMELSVDYYFDEVQHNEASYGIYLFDRPKPGDVLLEHGDWVKFMRTGMTF